MNKPLIVLTGPTAVGKTAASIQLAKSINGEIISADSIQVYKYMDIGSAKISTKEMDGIKHYLVDEIDPKEEFNAFEFKKRACKYIDEIYNNGKIPIIVGGTGFYIQTVLYDIKFEENVSDDTYRKELENLASINGPQYLHDMLKKIDIESANNIHYNNVKKVIRALEYYNQTGEKFSIHNKTQRENISPYNFRYYVLNDNRDVLYNNIDKRVDIMINRGLVNEVSGLLKMGYNKELVSMQGLGYKEIIDYLEGKFTLEDAIDVIKKETRHFAKRQLTWFRREKEVKWVNYYDFTSKSEAVNYIIEDALRLLDME